MAYSAVSAPDPWADAPPVYNLINDPIRALGAPAPIRLTPGERTHILAGIGQSNIANFIYGAPYAPSSPKVHVFNWRDGGVYSAVEPLPGINTTSTPNAYSNVMTRIGQKLIDANICDRVIIAGCAIGGSTTVDWADGGIYVDRLRYFIRRLQASGLPLTGILRHQGEGDPSIGTSSNTYRDRGRAEFQKFRDADFTAPAIVCQTTYWAGVNTPGSPEVLAVRAGQAAMADGVSIFLGPDTDTLGADKRGDAAHFNAEGANDFADMCVTAIQAHATPVS